MPESGSQTPARKSVPEVGFQIDALRSLSDWLIFQSGESA